MIKIEQENHFAAASMLRGGPQQLVVDAPVVPLAVVVRHVLSDDVPKLHLPEEAHPLQALVFDGAHKPFGESIQIRRTWRQMHSPNALAFRGAAESFGVFRVPIEN